MPITLTARTGALLIIGAGLLWGTIGIAATSLAQQGIDPISTGFYRFSVAALVLGALSGGRGLRAFDRRGWALVTLNGGLLAFSQTTYMAAVTQAGVTVATLITICLAPLAVVAFGLLTRTAQPTRTVGLSLLAALLGTTFLTLDSGGRATSAPDPLGGVALSLLAALSYAGVVLCGHRLTRQHAPLPINAASFAVGAALLGLVAVGNGLDQPTQPETVMLIVYLGIFPSVIAYALFVWAMRAVSAATASILTLTEPLAAAWLAALFFNEQLGAWGWLGAGLMCLGFALTLREK